MYHIDIILSMCGAAFENHYTLLNKTFLTLRPMKPYFIIHGVVSLKNHNKVLLKFKR